MREGWEVVSLGVVAELDIDKVRVDPAGQYRIAGVLNAGQGLLDRGSISGSETNYPSLHRLHNGQLVMRKLTAWEGPVTVVTPEFDGAFVSSEFPTFKLDPEHLDPGFMRLWCTMPGFWAAMRSAVTGTVQRRKRLSPSQLLAIPIDLPPLDQQRWIVDLIASLDTTVEAADRLVDVAVGARTAMLADLLAEPGDDWVETTLGQTATWRSGATPKATDASFYGGDIPFVTIGDLAGGLITKTERTLTDDGAREIGKLAPSGAVFLSMYGSIGKVGMAARPMATNQAIAWAEVDEVVCDGHFLLMWLSDRSAHFDGLGRGATQRNINRGIITSTAITLPPLNEQRWIADLVDAFDETVTAARSYTEGLRAVRSALLSDLLSGAHEIPESYDALLVGAA